MKSRIAVAMLILATVALVVGWIWPVHAQQSAAVRWEYCVLGSERSTGASIGTHSATDISYYTAQGWRTETVEAREWSRQIAVAKLGMEGWEIVWLDNDRGLIYFRRPIR